MCNILCCLYNTIINKIVLENNRFYNPCYLTVFNIWTVNGESP